MMGKQPKSMWSGEVLPEWIDYNGHMTEYRYLEVFGDSSDAFYREIGVDPEAAKLGAFFTLESHLRHVSECHLGNKLYSTTELLGYDEKRVHLFHRLYDNSDRLLATGEHLAIHVAHGKAGPAAGEMQAKIAAFFEAQEAWPLDHQVGSVLARSLKVTRVHD